MVSNLGKFLRKIRIDRNELLYDMAQNLGVSSAFLSKVENGKKKPPKEWRNLLIQIYELKGNDVSLLDQFIYEATNYDSIDISSFDDTDRMMMLSFARKFNTINKERLKDFLEREVDNE